MVIPSEMMFEGTLVLSAFAVGGIFGKLKGFVKGAAKGIFKGVKKLPVIGSALTVGQEAVKGALKRSAGSAQVQSEREVFNQQAFQAGQNVSTGAGLGFGAILSNPLLLVAGVALIALFGKRFIK